jgi:hypothetical protein
MDGATRNALSAKRGAGGNAVLFSRSSHWSTSGDDVDLA